MNATCKVLTFAAIAAGTIGLAAGPAVANTATLEADCNTATAHLFNFGPKAHDLTFGGYVHRDGKFVSFGGPTPINADANGNETITIPLTALTTPGNPVDVFLGAHWYDGQNVLHTESGQAVGLDCGEPETTTTTTQPPVTTTTTAPPETTTTTVAPVPTTAPAAPTTSTTGGVALAPSVGAPPSGGSQLPFTGHGPLLTILGIVGSAVGAGALASGGRRRKTV